MTVLRIPFSGNVPQVGAWIYVPTKLHFYRGLDDIRGGLDQIISAKVGVSAGEPTWFVVAASSPHISRNWEMLREKQKQLAGKFGQCLSRPDPDYRPEFNKGW
jgi:hypothetical protein